MPDRDEEERLGSRVLAGFLRSVGARMADRDDLLEAIRAHARSRGEEDYPWIPQWYAGDGAAFVNDLSTLCFSIPLEGLAGRRGLEFAQEVWMLRPSLFEHQTWDGRGYVRLWWDPDRPSRPREDAARELLQDHPVLAMPRYVAWSTRKRREGEPEALMSSLDSLVLLITPGEATALKEADFDSWLESARRRSGG